MYLVLLNKKIGAAIKYALSKGFHIHPNVIQTLEEIDGDELEGIIRDLIREKTRQRLFRINQEDLEEFLGIKDGGTLQNNHLILNDPTKKITSGEGIDGYSALFTDRFAKLKKIISNRPESKTLKSISSTMVVKLKDEVCICGLVTERKSERNIVKLVIEDLSSSIEVIVFDEELKKEAEGLLLDQFVMIKMIPTKSGGYMARSIILPDVPDRTINHSETEAHAVFLSDLHIGSKYFMEREFEEFTKWLGSTDSVARKVKFVLIAGDMVDGVGIYPNQDKELVFPTIESQLTRLEEVLAKIPDHIKVFMITGNHDPGRRALPQPALPEKYNKNLWDKENYYLMGNPSTVSLNGVKVLMFHGQSVDDIVKTTPGLSYDKPAKVMKHLIRARHLSPIYGSQTPIAPETQDMMVMEDVPDVFHTGHVHVVDLDMYRGTLLINSGAWQSQTGFQASVGITPTPGIAVIVNLKTFKVYYKDFK